MGKHHSDDYKETAIKYYMTTNDSLRNTCAIFGCCHTSLTRWINQYEENGNVKRKQRNNKNIKVLPQIEVFILEIVKDNPFLTLLEIAHLVSINFDIVLSQMTIHNILNQNKITRKRRKLRYFPPDQKISKAQELKQFYKNLGKIDKKKLISLDETAIYINMMPINLWKNQERKTIDCRNL